MADPGETVVVPDRAATAAVAVEAELDALQAGAVLEPAALRRLWAAIDRALPVAEAYRRHVADQWGWS